MFVKRKLVFIFATSKEKRMINGSVNKFWWWRLQLGKVVSKTPVS